jgi:tetratricopeptide (TPR) repeat protein
MTKYEQFKTENSYASMISECYDIARLFELLEEKEKSRYHYQKIVDEWILHREEVPDALCVNALKALDKPEEALRVVLIHPRSWRPFVLADLYEKMGKIEEAHLIYAGISHCSYELSEAYCSFWQPHYLQEAADLCEMGKDLKRSTIYNQKAVKAWEKMKNRIEKHLEPIEEAWLYEEVGYIYQKTGSFEMAVDYYKAGEVQYKVAYTEDAISTRTNQIDGDWNDYLRFFAKQVPDFRLIYFRSDGSEENDYRRIKYRILNLRETMEKHG